jgi:hypothetical protein
MGAAFGAPGGTVPTFRISQADFTLTAAFQRPEFGLFQNTGALISRTYDALKPHGVSLANMKIERGSGALSEFVLLSQLFNFALSIRTRIELVEITCVLLSDENLKRFSPAIVDVLSAVQGEPGPKFQSYALVVNLHGALEGTDTRSFLASFSAKTPPVGPPTGNAIGYYFGPTDERVGSVLILDFSRNVQGGLYMQINGTWDANKVRPQDLPMLVEKFIRTVVESVGLEVPRPA